MSKIDSVLAVVTEQGKTLAAMQQWQEGTHERIFGGSQPGVLQYLAAKDKELSDAITASNKQLSDALSASNKELKDGMTALKTDVDILKTEKRVSKAYGAGAIGLGTMIGYLIKVGLLKIGIHTP